MIIGINDGCIAWPIQLTYVCGSPGYVFYFIFWVHLMCCSAEFLSRTGLIHTWFCRCMILDMSMQHLKHGNPIDLPGLPHRDISLIWEWPASVAVS